MTVIVMTTSIPLNVIMMEAIVAMDLFNIALNVFAMTKGRTKGNVRKKLAIIFHLSDACRLDIMTSVHR